MHTQHTHAPANDTASQAAVLDLTVAPKHVNDEDKGRRGKAAGETLARIGMMPATDDGSSATRSSVAETGETR